MPDIHFNQSKFNKDKDNNHFDKNKMINEHLANKTEVDIKSYIDGLAISPLITKCKGNQPKKSYTKFIPFEKENNIYIKNESQNTSNYINNDNLNIITMKNIYNSIMKERNTYI